MKLSITITAMLVAGFLAAQVRNGPMPSCTASTSTIPSAAPQGRMWCCALGRSHAPWWPPASAPWARP